MMRKLAALMLVALSAVAFAAPPYDVDVTVNIPTSGGPVDSYELFLDNVSQGAVSPGLNAFPGLLTADGSYTFRVDATNAAGTTPGTPVTITVAELQAPGTTTITIQVDCAPCTTTTN